MKICLISPYESAAAYGLRLLSSSLKREGHEIALILLPLDFQDEIPGQALNRTVQIASGSRLVGISLSSNYVRLAADLTGKIREAAPEVSILWGGIHPTLEPEECLEYCDIACLGEAEEALCELAARMERGEPFTDTLNFYFKDPGGRIISNPVRPLNTKLDTLPFPDYSGENHFILDGANLVPVTPELLDRNLQGQYLTLSSRGCVHSCTFCCNNFLKDLYKDQRWFRKRGIENIIKECIRVKENLPWVKEILFDDDAFMARTPEELGRFSREYRERVGIPFFVTGITPVSLTEEKLKILLEGGLSRIRIGVQTASDRVNFEIYKRRIPHKKAEEAVRIMERHAHRLSRHHYDFIIENPWETAGENLDTLRFLLKIPRPWAINIYSLTFYPGTELYHRAKKEGLLTDKFREIYNKSYKKYKNTYINRLFFFFCQSQLPTWVLSLFVNRWIIALRLNHPLWWGYILLRDAKFHLRRLIGRLGRKD